MARGKKRSKQPGTFKKWFWRLFKTGLIAAFLGTIALAVAVLVVRSSLPGYEDLKSSPNGQMIRVLDVSGTELFSMGPSYGEWLDYDDIPQVMKDAMVSVEDRRFESHFGVDPIGLMRIVKVRFEQGRFSQGASTITQQLARNIFLNNNKTFGRKGREMLLALAMERKFSKEQILELYLNKVYYGGGAYGIDAASRRFFAHSARDLNLAEAAIIAGLVKAPSRYSPTADAQAAIDRATVVLRVMQDAGTITASQAASTKPKSVKLAPEPRQNSVRYFTDWALPQLDLIIDEAVEPIEVWTTLDLGMQRAATNAIQTGAPAGAQGALIAIDRDGAVRAMVGGTDYVTSNYNRATQAVRQPGSAWKVFVYMAALEAGYSPDDTVTDEPITIGGWTPRNSGGSYAGDMSVRNAFAYSKNTVAAAIGNDIGTSSIANMARRFGITTPINVNPSMVLGTSDVRLLDMTRAFASINAKGVAVTPFGITKVTTMKGKLLYQSKFDGSRVLVDPWVAAGITDLMQTAVNAGTGRAAQIGRPVAGKTGTTSSNKDGWFLGFSSGLTTGVWMGRDDAKPVNGLQGGRAPAAAFAAFMKVAVAKRKIEKFDTELVLPEWQLEPDDEALFGEPEEGLFVDENGMPIESGPPYEYDLEGGDAANDPQQLDQEWIDSVLGRSDNPAAKKPPAKPSAKPAVPPADKPKPTRPARTEPAVGPAAPLDE
ncbi:transglycosylase domain-containing protein [Parasphingorhabdus halotolerans]|uniref:PBP1A family penicillin-binding protein n=1 Tax=Parasphingorhabdus halotolerans TaxID=2725558 RepID=A0A6H2DMS6_9SPHN|nr:PBP1A family penicillin-binding protein [Parasphingorhabdus halotolerans]QJB69654.1 PBP1A family penicillin-binding protein [Parasphingorhabdus halotolerans]